MGMKPTMRIYFPTIPLSKLANIPASHKPVITIQNARVKFHPVNTTVMLSTPETTFKTLVIITRVSFQLDAKLSGTWHIGIAMCPPKTSWFKLFLIRHTIIAVATIIATAYIVIIVDSPATITTEEPITPTIATITITIGTTGQIVTNVPTVATITLPPASSFPTIFTEHISVNIVNLVITESSATTVTDIPIVSFGTILTKPSVDTLMGIGLPTKPAAMPLH
jgi:hypothetical protein